jgi:hypothetical protein
MSKLVIVPPPRADDPPRLIAVRAAQLKAKFARRKATLERSTTHQYDRLTTRSVFRSIQRRLAGRWDGKPVTGGR